MVAFPGMTSRAIVSQANGRGENGSRAMAAAVLAKKKGRGTLEHRGPG
jgi:hypothetical protein